MFDSQYAIYDGDVYLVNDIDDDYISLTDIDDTDEEDAFWVPIVDVEEY